ncbi:MAG: FHA domain-containing protein [Lachnospiraceae bacterium]|nr:FHA domain-containing protein [Lachnospiraceae bacterium]
MIWIIILLICALIEFIFALVRVKTRNSKEKSIRRSLYRLVEKQVLNRTLKERVTSDEALEMECRKPFLYVEFPDTKPLVMCLFSLDECVTVGRSRENRLCIRDDSVSRMHCKIGCVNDTLLIQDMGSANGTVLRRGIFGKTLLTPGQQELLEAGNRILVGDYKMRIGVYRGWEINT